MEKYLVLFTFIGSLLALCFAFIMAKKVLKEDKGTEKMAKISGSIKQGANAYLKRQYRVVFIFFAGMFLIAYRLLKIKYRYGGSKMQA